MGERPKNSRYRCPDLILPGVLVALLYWVVETGIHAYVFGEGDLFALMLPSDKNELWMRLLIFSCVVGFSVYAQTVVTRRRLSEDALRKSRELYTALAESAEDYIYIVGGDFRFRYVNASAARLLKRPTEELRGAPLGDFFPPGEFEFQKRNIAVVLDGRKPLNVEEMFKVDGTELWLNTTLVPLDDGAGGHSAVMGISRDVTGRKRAEELLRAERDRAQKYLDVAGVVFVILDVERKVVLINRKGCEVLGYEEGEAVGKDWFEYFIPAEARAELAGLFERLVRGDRPDGEYHENQILTKSGARRLVAWHNAVLTDRDGSITAVLSSGSDITERRAAEDALKERVDELERFRKVAVERELRMRELKDRLAMLEKPELAIEPGQGGAERRA